jgi:glutamyl-tRNA synthetase
MVRVRFAPSPTGELHLGGARTALYNYLFAQQQGGQFIIRLEDTDQERFVEGSLDRILENLTWLGLNWTEGPDKGGPYAPYIQSQRLPIYQQHALELIKKGAAYYCFCSQSRLEVLRQVQAAEHKISKYDRTCLQLNPAEVQAKLEAKTPHTIRLKVPPGQTTFRDLVHGDITVLNENLDDAILLKSDGFPTYHLANVVDDHLMGITHVIRGEEWLPSTPKHILLYQGFAWKPPIFAHLPNVLNEKKAKLSKRKDGELVWLQTYRTKGYLPQAMANYLALLGWHPKDNRELFTLAELVKVFELERVQKAGAIFSLTKLDWFNSLYIRKLSVADLDALLKPYYTDMSAVYGLERVNTVALSQLLQDRLTTLSSVREHAAWFFKKQVELTPALLIPKQSDQKKTLHAIQSAYRILSKLNEWTETEIKDALETLIRPGTFSRSDLLWPVRVALTGEKKSPDVFGVAWVLGKANTLARLAKAAKILT